VSGEEETSAKESAINTSATGPTYFGTNNPFDLNKNTANGGIASDGSQSSLPLGSSGADGNVQGSTAKPGTNSLMLASGIASIEQTSISGVPHFVMAV
jgi:hypothetical protein